MKIQLTSQDKQRLYLLKAKIDCDYTTFNYTLQELCKLYKMSDHKLRYGFEALNGETIIEYQMKKRLHHITELLKSEDVSLSEAVYDAGFQDYSTFYRSFRKTYNMPPNQWRKMNAV
jgi:AraC-like DNA-binding protein